MRSDQTDSQNQQTVYKKMISSYETNMRSQHPSNCCGKRKRTISGNITDKVSNDLPARKIVRVMSSTVPATLIKKQDSTSCSPQQCLESLLSSNKDIRLKIHTYDSLPGFFEATNDEEIQAYGFDVLTAIRDSDIDQLRSFHQQGRPLKCSNQFGESLLHLACRLGLVSVVDFLIHEAGVPLQVVDDMGRTPLHDAFWTREPNTDLVDMILKDCPDLLFISDKRGDTPLSYARRNDWCKWNDYLKGRQSMLVPKILNRPGLIKTLKE